MLFVCLLLSPIRDFDLDKKKERVNEKSIMGTNISTFLRFSHGFCVEAIGSCFSNQ